MPHIEKSALITKSPQLMFDLVDHIEDYPQFLPWCGQTELLLRTDTITSARLHINFKGIRTHFSTENHKHAPHRMDIQLRDGPFRCLNGCWLFTALGREGCKIVFQLNYEFSSKLLEKAIGPVFALIVPTFVDSFIKRAEFLHGN